MQPAVLCAVMTMLSHSSPTSDIQYARPEMLMEPAALAQPEAARQLIVLDARDRKSFDEGRIPGARWVDAAAWAKAFGTGKDAEAWGAKIGALGIGADSKVVVYDGVSFKDAARIWWLLRYWGVEDVRLLNGGWAGWKKAGLPVETKKPLDPKPARFAAAPHANRLATKARMLDAVKAKDLQIVDARSESEFCGLDKLTNKRAGAIPGAKNLDWTDLIDKKTQRFKDADELSRLFAEAGIDLDKPTAAHCQSGGRSSVMHFAMELMGAKDVSNYYASWGEWGNADDTPIAAGQPKKKK